MPYSDRAAPTVSLAGGPFLPDAFEPVSAPLRSARLESVRRRFALLLLVLAGALPAVAAGCGGDDDTGDTTTPARTNPAAGETTNDPGRTATDLSTETTRDDG